MEVLIQGNSQELLRSMHWWNKLEAQWKMAFNEVCMGKGPTLALPTDEELMMLLVRANALRFAGPLALSPNCSHMPNNLSGLQGLKQLGILSFTDSNITSLAGIEGLTNLKSLFVYNNKLTSLKGVENMLQLKELYCQHNAIESLAPIYRLTQLETLYASNNHLTSLEGVTAKHADRLRNFYIMPNDSLPHREVVRVQTNYYILGRKG